MYNAPKLNDLMLQTTARNGVFSGGCPNLGSNLAPPTSTYLVANWICTGATMRVPAKRAVCATSGTRAIGSPSLA